jgi:hypothetical protein
VIRARDLDGVAVDLRDEDSPRAERGAGHHGMRSPRSTVMRAVLGCASSSRVVFSKT